MLAGPEEAESGDLLAVIGGDKGDVAKVQDLLGQISKETKYFGEVGNGHLMKLAVNYCSLVQAVMFAQVYPIMKKYGLDEHTVYDGLNNEIFDNWVFQFYSKRYVSHDYFCGFSLDNGIKDLSYMKRLYEDQGIPSFVLDGALTLARVTRKDQEHNGELEFAHVARTMYQLLGFEK
jgi:3-hydroxyisobutyrate dehydrogenase-like beta-hydroxyacid dehydrogenase